MICSQVNGGRIVELIKKKCKKKKWFQKYVRNVGYNIDGEIELAHNISDEVLQMIKWSWFDENVYIDGVVMDLFLNE